MLTKKNKKCVVAGKKASKVRWMPRYDALRELAKYYGNDKKQTDDFQFKWKTDQLITLLHGIGKKEI